MAKAFSRSFPLLFQDFCILCQLVPVIRMHRSEVSHEILFALEVLLAGQARLRKQRSDVVIKEDVCSSVILHCLQDQAMRCELFGCELCSVLKCSVIMTHVLFETMLRQVHLAAFVTGKSDL